jgi:hypothetical protein
MANDLTNRPIKLDGTMAGGAGLNRPLRVVSVRLIAGTTASWYTIIDPASSKVLAKGATTANGPNDDLHFAELVHWKDFKLSAIAGTGAVVLIVTV